MAHFRKRKGISAHAGLPTATPYPPHLTTSRCHFVHAHAAPPDLGRGAFQVKIELHRMPAKAELLCRDRRPVVPREAIGRGVIDMMHGPI